MSRSAAATVEEYLAELPADRRESIAAVRSLILAQLPPGYEEAMNWGMICYQVPLDRYDRLPGRRPLMYLGLAAGKGSLTLHVMSVAGQEARLRSEFAKAGKKLDMGKACIHFQRPDDLPFEVIAELVRKTPVDGLIGLLESSRGPKPRSRSKPPE